MDFALDYNVLHSARDDLYRLAGDTGPTLKNSEFATLGKESYSVGEDVFGDMQLAAAFNTLYYRAERPLDKAGDDLRRLGDVFGAVADAFFNADAQIAQGAGFMSSQMGLADWRADHDAWLKHDQWQHDKDLWDQYQANKGACDGGGDGDPPDFCKATDPGPEPHDPGPPPTEHVITTPDGSTVKTDLVLGDDYHVDKETTTVTTSAGQTWSSTTTFKDDGRSYLTDTTFADGTTAHADVTVQDDGSGRMVVTDDDGEESVYTRSGTGAEWKQISGPDSDD